MSILTIQHYWQAPGGLPEDRFVNTFHVWVEDAGDAGQHSDIAVAVNEFFHPDGRAGFKLFLAQACMGLSVVKLYNVDDPKPRVPLYETSTTNQIGSITDRDMPYEVALCLSYTAAPASGTTPARRRGRAYIGPFNIQAAHTTIMGRPAASLLTTMLTQATAFCDELNTAGAALVTYSPTSDAGGDTSLQSSKLVSEFWVDNAWDTQRRRGMSASSRNTTPAGQDPLVFLDL